MFLRLLIVILLLPSFVFSQISTESKKYIKSLRVEPLVVRKGIDPYQMFIKVKDPTIQKIEIQHNSEIFTLLNNGLGNDLSEQDSIFSSESHFIAKTASGDISGYTILGTIIFTFQDGRTETFKNQFCGGIRYFTDGYIETPTIKTLSEKAYVTEYIYYIILNEIGDYPNQEFGDSTLNNSLPARARFYHYYESFPDDRDFLITPYLLSYIGAAGFFNPVSNNIHGIGKGIYNNASQYYSNGKLQGIVSPFIPEADDLAVIKHELLHNWAVYLDKLLYLGNPHWDYVEFPSTGFYPGSGGAYSKIEQVTDSTYLCLLDNIGYNYNELELYLMGLMSPNEITYNYKTLVNANFLKYNDQGPVYTADSLITVDINAIISIEGERIPNSFDSQKEFYASYILAYDRKLSEIEFAYFNYIMKEAEKPHSELGLTFQEATGNRATLTTKILDIIPVNDPPRIRHVSDFAFENNEIYSINLDTCVIDEDDDVGSLAWKVIPSDANLHVDIADHIANFNAPNWTGTTEVKFTVTDPQGASDSAMVKATVELPSVIEKEENSIPKDFFLSQNYPNPFNQQTTIHFGIPKSSEISVIVYNVKGEKIEYLFKGKKDAGNHFITWDATDKPSGIYLIRFQADSYIQVKKCLLMK